MLQSEIADVSGSEPIENAEATILNDEGYKYKTVRRLKYRQRRDVSEIANEYLPPAEETVTEAIADVKSEEEPQESAVLGADGYEYKTVRRLKYRKRRDVSEIANEYLPPAEETVTETAAEVKSAEEPQDSAVLGADGYEYKTVRRLKYRQRRDVSEIVNEYLPPAEEEVTEAVVKSEEEAQDSAVLGADGYEYKTVRRLKYRKRRDVSDIANEYLPPAEEEVTEAIADVKSEEEPQESAVLGADGYEYKTVRRLKYRQRRDVSEIANEYLPPAEEEVTEAVVKSEEEPQSAVLGADGYEYKTVRRLKYRKRRDVSEIVNGYLPPAEEELTEAIADVKSEEEPQESAVLGADGYEYKTVRRLKYRQRRDVSEIANEYLPPAEEEVTEAVVKSEEEPQESAVLGADGYEYKTVRRLKYRKRRDVSEIANEYLPPAEETVTEAIAEVKSEEEPQESAVLGADGYEYKTVRRLKYRQRRDVSEIANEYLPPAEEEVTEAAVKSEEEPQDSAVLGADGYEYKTVRRLKYRKRRDVSEIANEYLPPAEETVTEAIAEVKSEEEPQESAVLRADGYEYKTVRRLKYRQRRDVSEIDNEYLPPAEEEVTEAVVKSEDEPQDSAVLGADGYEYKTVRRLKYRKRRDVSEIANEYLPPAEETVTEAIAEVKSEEEPQGSAVLGADGYEYKTVRRLKYRQRRDVSEITNEYLPPAEEDVTEAVVKSEEEPQDSAVLGADGYEYKTVRRLKYRKRRDVSEIANEYLPPAEEAVTEAIAEVKSEEEPQESAVLGADGYEYKTVRRLKYRHRRDVSEIANEYLPPAEEEVTETVADVKSEEEPQGSAVLGADGYEYKTVRRLKYRHRRDVSEIANEYLPPAEEEVTEAVAEVKSEEEPQDSAVLGADGYEYKTVRRLKYRKRRDTSTH
ncbi:uncharacterized protein [Musca autumnalis]|uniref:uncharacterized protein n=1 Tax=Musca autumnalis TaxID=221902 RepID=UPI003CE969E4